MLVGEAGTGREAFARYMHSLGPRAAGAFVVVTCASLDDTNAADKLRGVASGGKAEPGLFEQAHGGTLFLGGVEDLTPNAQRLLLADLGQHGWQRRARPRSFRSTRVSSRGRSPGTTVPASGLAARPDGPPRGHLDPHPAAAGVRGGCPGPARATTWTAWWTKRP